MYEKDENGNIVAKVIDANGDVVTDKSGNAVTVKPDITTTAKNKTTAAGVTRSKNFLVKSTRATNKTNAAFKRLGKT